MNDDFHRVQLQTRLAEEDYAAECEAEEGRRQGRIITYRTQWVRAQRGTTNVEIIERTIDFEAGTTKVPVPGDFSTVLDAIVSVQLSSADARNNWHVASSLDEQQWSKVPDAAGRWDVDGSGMQRLIVPLGRALRVDVNQVYAPTGGRITVFARKL